MTSGTSNTTASRTTSPLDMIHFDEVYYGGEQATWDPRSHTVLDHDSTEYIYGGHVRRVEMSGGTYGHPVTFEDYMICNPNICSSCSAHLTKMDASVTSSPVNGLPFVHYADLRANEDRTRVVFQPNHAVKRAQTGNIILESNTHMVVFWDGKARPARVCNKKACHGDGQCNVARESG